jgi:hypothetical protein
MAKQKTWHAYWLGKPQHCSVFTEEARRDQAFLVDYDGMDYFNLGMVAAESSHAALEEVLADQWLPGSLKTPWYGFWIGEDHVSIYAVYPTATQRGAEFTRRYDGVSEYILGIVPAGSLEEALDLVEAEKWVAYTQRT